MSEKKKVKNTGSTDFKSVEYPDFYARFYDLIYHDIRDGVDNDYYLERIKETEGKILEVGVGTGRLFILGLEYDADIYGIDISPSMLEILKGKISNENQKRISLQNIIDFKSALKYDLIIAPFRVFMHLVDKDDQLKALDNVHFHLKPGGRFIFDVFVPDLKYLINGYDKAVDFEREFEPGNKFKRTVSTEPDLINQIIKVTFRLEWNENESYFDKVWKTRLRFFFRYELEHLVERSRFKTYQIFGDFNRNRLTSDSKEFIVTCVK